MTIETNHSLSVDCVIFGYDNGELKILLVDQKHPIDDKQLLKLPGSMILENETLPDAAQRVLIEQTGLERVHLRQNMIYSDPKRVSGQELSWIASYHNITTTRVVTVGYYAMVRITARIMRHTRFKRAVWQSCDNIPRLAMDHTSIFRDSLKRLRREFETSTIAFELLPCKFTIRELQDLHSAVMGIKLDNRNFRKKILNSQIIKPTGERQKGVAHKPAEYYTFNRRVLHRA